jgi:hypothetical protein
MWGLITAITLARFPPPCLTFDIVKKSHSPWRLFPVFLACMILVGCSKHTAAALAPDKVPEAINHAFNQSTGDAKNVASQVVLAWQDQNVTAAFTNLETLSHRNDLTPEQRSVTARALVATIPKLQAAATTGDPDAQATLHKYFSTR